MGITPPLYKKRNRPRLSSVTDLGRNLVWCYLGLQHQHRNRSHGNQRDCSGQNRRYPRSTGDVKLPGVECNCCECSQNCLRHSHHRSTSLIELSIVYHTFIYLSSVEKPNCDGVYLIGGVNITRIGNTSASKLRGSDFVKKTVSEAERARFLAWPKERGRERAQFPRWGN